MDPKNPRNAVIADIDKAPRNAAGLVEFSSDFVLQRPISGGNGAALVDVVNRGGPTALRLNRSARPGDAADDGLLRKMGVVIMAVGWEFDVPARNGAIRIEVPVATENGAVITGIVRATFTPNNKEASFTVGDLASYAPVDVNGADTVLTVRDRLSDRTGQPVPRDKWKLAGNVVTMTGGFEPGRNYEIAYRAANPPVSGLGLAAVRDAATWLKHTPDALAPVKFVYALGVSQSGRFLRDYLYEGFNTDEKQRQVFDGMMVHIAGASQLDLNRRWATPTGLGQYDATLFPFADRAQKDAASGATDGLLDNDRARKNLPKIFYTNTGVEYWGGGQSAALIHTSADGTTDLTIPANVRVYFFAGNQHGPGAFPPAAGAGQQKGNPTDYWWNMRALFVAMDKWVREGAAPPPSQIPHLSDGTLAKAADVAFPELPGVQSPKTLTAGSRAANPFPRRAARARARRCRCSCRRSTRTATSARASGCRKSPCRWPPTPAGISGAPPPAGRTSSCRCSAPISRWRGRRAEREARHDPRPSIEERYASRQQYLDAINKSAAALVKSGYLLAGDVPSVVKRATEHWEFAALRAELARCSRWRRSPMFPRGD